MLTQIFLLGILGFVLLPLLVMLIWQGVEESRVPQSAKWYKLYK